MRRQTRIKTSWFLEAVFMGRRLKRARTVVDGSSDIKAWLDAPLVSWINYHNREAGGQVRWMGIRTLKIALDAWIYQEILYDVRPDIVLEIGNKYGGSTLFLAGMCELLGHGRVLALDWDHEQFQAQHDRIDLLTGDCSNPTIVAAVHERCQGKKVLIIHDAIHSKEGKLRDLRLYSGLVSPGSYFIVEDTFAGLPGVATGRDTERTAPLLMQRTDTPLQAIEEFLIDHPEFEIDRARERYILSHNYHGFLRRMADD